jgi:hypothetical protein
MRAPTDSRHHPSRHLGRAVILAATCLLALGGSFRTHAAEGDPARPAGPAGQSSHSPTLVRPRFEEREFTPWLPNRVLVDQLKKEQALQHFPVFVEGRAENYAVEFRAVLRPRPKGFQLWEARWNISDEEFEAMHQRLLQRGFILYSRSEFAGLNGETRFNGVWIKVKG